MGEGLAGECFEGLQEKFRSWGHFVCVQESMCSDGHGEVGREITKVGIRWSEYELHALRSACGDQGLVVS